MTKELPPIGHFIEHLKQKDYCKKLAYLKLTGCLEDYMVKEYIYFLKEPKELDAVFNFSGKNFDKDTNPKNCRSSKFRVDICVLDKQEKIRGFIEAKFFTNCIKVYDKAGGNSMPKKQKEMVGELAGRLQKLKELKSFGCYDVQKPEVKALIVFSYVSKSDKKSQNGIKKFWGELIEISKKEFNNPGIKLSSLYGKKGAAMGNVSFCGENYYVDFAMGLWTPKRR